MSENPFAIAHLLVRLRAINRALRAAVESRGAASARLDRPDMARVCITDREVARLLDHVDALAGAGGGISLVPELDNAEEAAIGQLRVAAEGAGACLPLDRLSDRLGLTAFEEDALLLVAAPEIDSAYERIYAYILDDVDRGSPSVELLALAGTVQERLLRRRPLSRAGTLRRCGLLVDVGAPSTEARQELALGLGVLDFLLAVTEDLEPLVADPNAVPSDAADALLTGSRPAGLGKLLPALASGSFDVLGVWGGRPAAGRELVTFVAASVSRPVRRLCPSDLPAAPADARTALLRALHTAACTGAVLWVPLDPPDEPGRREALDQLAELLARSAVPVVLTGPTPWRPVAVLSRRRYVEIEVTEPSYDDRRTLWSQALPELDRTSLDTLSARYRLGGLELSAVASLARATAWVNGNGSAAPVEASLPAAASAIARRGPSRLAVTVRPDRSPDELILPDDQHRQVMEIARFFDAWPRVARAWGFEAVAGAPGMKALLAGEPGTGKTLAAEVIASCLGLDLMKVDLSRLVSKWVGETEKNLDAVFREAEESQAVLFFDEADALFGKRGEVDRGSDRYANLEVGFLLQRLEQFAGLALLASNLTENIDPAFTRRFHAIVHFPRPSAADRIRLWRRALPDGAPLDADVDLDALSALDLTGAGITSAARSAALLAATSGATTIAMTHLVAAVARQYQREARVLRPGELGRYAALLADR